MTNRPVVGIKFEAVTINWKLGVIGNQILA